MIDRLGRNITYLRISVTELCNLRCRYCMPAGGICKKRHEDMLTEDELIQAVEAAASLGITKLRITGGEPLIKKNIVSICRRAASVPGIEELCLTTNGLLLPELAAPLREAGVRRINLSLDTLDPKKYADITRGGSLEQALAGLQAAGLEPKLSHFSFCTNGSHFCGEAGIPTVGFGPSLERLAHVIDEYIEIDQLELACRGFQGILSALLTA